MKFSLPESRYHQLVSTMNLNLGPVKRLTGVSTLDKTKDARVHTLEECQHAVKIVLPLHLEMVGWWSLPARQLCSQLQAVGEQIVEVLHPVVHQVPLCPVTDPCTELVTVTQTLPEIGGEALFIFSCLRVPCQWVIFEVKTS